MQVCKIRPIPTFPQESRTCIFQKFLEQSQMPPLKHQESDSHSPELFHSNLCTSFSHLESRFPAFLQEQDQVSRPRTAPRSELQWGFSAHTSSRNISLLMLSAWLLKDWNRVWSMANETPGLHGQHHDRPPKGFCGRTNTYVHLRNTEVLLPTLSIQAPTIK